MRTILVVDDEKDIIEMLRYNLVKEGFSVLIAQNGKQALEQANKSPNLIVLDIMIPEYDGIEVLRRLKKSDKTNDIPVIFLTAKGTETDEVLGLELGADDYIIKPISIPKLIARIKNVLRKKEDKLSTTESSIAIGEIKIIPSQHLVQVKGKEIFFPKKEFEVLLYLMKHADNVVTRETLLDAVWGSDVTVVARTVDVHIRKIREKLGASADCIDTIKGVGYKLKKEL